MPVALKEMSRDAWELAWENRFAVLHAIKEMGDTKSHFDDMFCAGLQGAQRAFERLDPNKKKYQKNSYILKCIKSVIRREALDDRTIRIPENTRSFALQLRKGRIGMQDIPARRHDDVEAAIRLMDAEFSGANAIDALTSEPDFSDTLIDQIDAREKTAPLWAALNERETYVVRARLGFDGPEMTFKDISSTLGTSREFARQTYSHALVKLRTALTHEEPAKPPQNPTHGGREAIEHPEYRGYGLDPDGNAWSFRGKVPRLMKPHLNASRNACFHIRVKDGTGRRISVQDFISTHPMSQRKVAS